MSGFDIIPGWAPHPHAAHLGFRVLYLPIFEGGSIHETAVKHKRGLYDALVRYGCQVFEYDYLKVEREYQPAVPGGLFVELRRLILMFQPDLLLTQFHGADPITADMLKALRLNRPEMKVINWSGDSHRHSLLGAPMVELSHHFDLLLVPTLDVLPELEAAGIRTAYWNIAFEPPVVPLPDVPTYDVVFLGNVFNDQRRALVSMLRTLPYKVGIYGDWEHADGNNVYNFAEQQALYKKATLAIADNYRPDNLNYVSDRPFNIMAAGGALCLHQHVDTMKELTGLSKVYHYAEWSDLEDLRGKLGYWLRAPEADRKMRVQNAQEFVLKHHSFDARVKQLFEEYLPKVTP